MTRVLTGRQISRVERLPGDPGLSSGCTSTGQLAVCRELTAWHFAVGWPGCGTGVGLNNRGNIRATASRGVGLGAVCCSSLHQEPAGIIIHQGVFVLASVAVICWSEL